jgi:LEA14-like dessication related protein
MKFSNLTFTTENVILIVGGAISFFTFYMKIDNRLNEFEIKIQKIISQIDINDIKTNAKIDALKPISNNGKSIDTLKFLAVIPENRLSVKKRKLFKYKLI